MALQNCIHCGKETTEGDLYCQECLTISGAAKPRRLWLFSILFAVLFLSLVGMLFWHGGLEIWGISIASIWEKPAAILNGEAISQDEFRSRMKRIQAAVERQYGREIFNGERGRAVLEVLEQRALDGMLIERLVAQEARKLKIDVREQQVKEEVEKISKEISGSWEKFQAKLGEDGITEKELKDHIRTILLYNAVKTAKSPVGADPETSFNAWLIQARQNAEVAIYAGENWKGNTPSLMGGCCAPDAGSGGTAAGSRGGSTLDPRTENEAKKVGLEAYLKANPAEKEAAAKVTNYGCHIQVDILKDGKIVKSYSYRGGKAYEIS